MLRKQTPHFLHIAKKYVHENHGTLLIEYIAVIAIFILLTGFITVSLAHTQEHVSINSTIDQLVADIKQQQVKAMIDDTEGRGTSAAYGIHFDSNKYTLFHGLTFSANDSSNFAVILDTNLQFSTISFPGSNIIFATQSGELVGFVNGQNTVKILNTAGNNAKTVTINQYGTVTGVN